MININHYKLWIFYFSILVLFFFWNGIFQYSLTSKNIKAKNKYHGSICRRDCRWFCLQIRKQFLSTLDCFQPAHHPPPPPLLCTLIKIFVHWKWQKLVFFPRHKIYLLSNWPFWVLLSPFEEYRYELSSSSITKLIPPQVVGFHIYIYIYFLLQFPFSGRV